jgi:cell division protein ZapE
MGTPLEIYQKDLEKEEFVADAAQALAVSKLEALYKALVAQEKPRLLGKWFGKARKEPQRGLYLWGGVGRGKTYLMDIFFDSLPFPQKMRLHFHRFMRRVHADLRTYKGEVNPLEKVADGIAGEARILCFDEFFVTDITDAMILANMLEALFERGVTLVTTSNIVPDDLYKDGLQRSRFIPAIELIKKHTEVLNVDGGIDYRLRALERVELYHSPWDEEARGIMWANFENLLPDANEVERNTWIDVNGRKIAVEAICEDVIWFDFYAICDGPRSQNDYIELSCEFHAVLISNVPAFKQKDDQARRFINLVDEFYDRHVNLILGAEVPLDALYVEGRLAFEFQRTQSRLLEMQSKEYLGRAHLA